MNEWQPKQGQGLRCGVQRIGQRRSDGDRRMLGGHGLSRRYRFFLNYRASTVSDSGCVQRSGEAKAYVLARLYCIRIRTGDARQAAARVWQGVSIDDRFVRGDNHGQESHAK